MFTLSSQKPLLRGSETAHFARSHRKKSSRVSLSRVGASAGLMPEKMKATGKRLLVIPDSEESTTAGGILLMSSSENAGPGSSICGSVASVGAECKTVKQGDSVLINGFAGSEIEFEDGSKGKFVTEEDVLASLG